MRISWRVIDFADIISTNPNPFLFFSLLFSLSTLFPPCRTRFRPWTTTVQALSQHLEDADVDAFTEEVKSFDQVSRLDQWYTTILLRVKKQIPDPNELC